MSFRIHHLGLIEELGMSIRQIGKSIYDGQAPSALHHYTSLPTVESIINTRSVWATCLADQADQAELTHGIDWVQEAVGKLLRKGGPDFPALVLQQLKESMIERRQWTFIVCFCGDGNSDFHWDKYGQYCLTFPIPRDWRPTLRCSDPRAENWYQRVIYDHAVQRKTMLKSVQAVSDCIARHSAGTPEGPWIKWMAKDCARNAAQLLLSIAVGFKHKKYAKEKEWRLVYYPNLALNNSAPNIADENFKVSIKESPRRHLALQIPPDMRLFQPLLRPQVPFIGVRQSPLHRNTDERLRIERVLSENFRSDIKCL
jgi:hypothetical protein